jgi:hypothetical protein
LRAFCDDAEGGEHNLFGHQSEEYDSKGTSVFLSKLFLFMFMRIEIIC